MIRADLFVIQNEHFGKIFCSDNCSQKSVICFPQFGFQPNFLIILSPTNFVC